MISSATDIILSRVKFVADSGLSFGKIGEECDKELCRKRECGMVHFLFFPVFLNVG